MKSQSITISKNALIISIVSAVVIIAGVITAILVIQNKKPLPENKPVSQEQSPSLDIDPDASEWTGLQPEDRVGETQVGIKIPGYPSITIPKDKSDITVALLNPEGNPCYFRFELLLKDSGETLYTSKLVPPGQAITNVTLSKPLPEGDYPAIIRISTVSLEDGSAMNGANVETVLKAK